MDAMDTLLAEATASSSSAVQLLDHVIGRVYLLAKSQGGSRFVQQKLDEGDPVYFNVFFNELKMHVSELMMDRQGAAVFFSLCALVAHSPFGA